MSLDRGSEAAQGWEGEPRHPSAHDLRVRRAALRRERGRIHAEAISGGPTPELCERLNALEQEELHLAREERIHRSRRGGAMKGILGHIGLGGS